MPKAKKFTATPTTEEFEIPKNTNEAIYVPKNLGQCPDDKILVLQDEAIQQTAGGIFIPDLSQEKPFTGIVIKVGPRTDGKPSNIEEEDRIIFGQHSGIELNILGVAYLLMSFRDILWNFKH